MTNPTTGGTNRMKTFRRDKLRRLIEERRVEVVGSYHFDDMTGSSRDGAQGMLAAMMPADRTEVRDGICYLHPFYFTGSGRAWENPNGTVTMIVHSNLNFDFKILERPRPEERECMVCFKPTTHRFFCPCDLEHPICEGNHADRVPRLDCAYIRGGTGHFTTMTGRA
jgi:hypothetical protein